MEATESATYSGPNQAYEKPPRLTGIGICRGSLHERSRADGGAGLVSGLMENRDWDIAADVVRQANLENPADAVLRAVLKKQRELLPEESRAVSRAVFAYYRWKGWLDGGDGMFKRLAQADELQQRFTHRPASFSETELRARSVPEWTAQAMEAPVAWVRALQAEPRLWLRAHAGQGRVLAEKLGDCWVPEQAALADAVEYRGTENLFATPEFHAGEFEVQDISSQAVGLLCAPQPGETWWDACAGEGGKLLHLSDLMRNKGLIWASDRADWRLKKLKRRTARAKVFNYRAVVWDGGAKPPTKTKFDGVLVDAPCSGLGTWQRNPHARWTTTPEDVRELGELQIQLLAHAAGSVKPGGKLVYSVCTLTRAETVEVAEAFARQFPEFQPLPLTHPMNASVPASPHVWMWPQEDGGNGMFVAAWQR